MFEYVDNKVTDRKVLEETVLPKALEQVNSIRTALAIGDGALKELPKGSIGEAHHCVLARALSNGWKAGVYPGEEIYFEHPGLGYDDFRRAAETLEVLGLSVESFGESWVCVEPTLEMSQLAWAFDDGLIPELVLEDDS
jgi:hypothetical protein